MKLVRGLVFVFGAAAFTACHQHGPDGHDHGAGSKSEAEADEPEPIAITRWTDRYELFVEFPPPSPGKAVPYHAHVTRLSDFAAVTKGTFRVRFKKSGAVAAEGTQTGTKRPGIFVFESPAPGAGVYQLEMSYEHEGRRDEFDCGSLTVSDDAPAATEEASGASITFLKESQWKIPFGTGWAKERPLAKEMEVTATVEPAGSDQLTVGASTGGRFFHNPKLLLAEGLVIKKGDLLGRIAPNVAGDDFSRLQFAVEESRLAKSQISQEIERVKPLVKEGLLPEKRLIELQNELAAKSAVLSSAGSRLGRVTSPGRGGGLSVKSTLAGTVSQVLVPNGEPVDAGAPLVRIGGTDHLWIRARFVAKPASTLAGAHPSRARLPSGETVALEERGARFLSSLPVVDPRSRIATWIVDMGPQKSDKSPPPNSEAQNLRPGSNVVLSVRFGKPQLLLAVPKSAVVDISTRSYVFVQSDGEHFEKRAVTLGRTDGDWVHIETGLSKGERVVTRGGFDVHLASLMGTVESHRH